MIASTVLQQDLEAAIRHRRDSQENWLVYADWLQSRGDPRGELIAILLSGTTRPEASPMRRRQGELWQENRARWLAGLPPSPALALTWRHAFIDTATLSVARCAPLGTDPAEVMRALLAHPSAIFLRGIAISGSANHDPMPALEALTQSPSAARIELLSISAASANLFSNRAGFREILSRLTGVRELGLRIKRMPAWKLDEIWRRDPEVLRIGGPRLVGAAVTQLGKQPWHRLRRLEIRLSNHIRATELRRILDGTRFPKLEHLALMDVAIGDNLCLALTEAAILPRLRSLDFSTRTAEEPGLRALERAKKRFAHIRLFPSVEVDSNPGRLFTAGRLISRMGDPERALPLFDRAIAQNPSDVHWDWVQKGNALHDLGRFPQSLEAYEQSIRAAPEYGIAWHNKANCLRCMGRYREGEAAMERAILLGQTEADAYQLMGALAKATGNTEAATAALRRALGLWQAKRGDGDEIDRGKNRYQMACVHALLDEGQTALAILEELAARDPGWLRRAAHDPDFQSLRGRIQALSTAGQGR